MLNATRVPLRIGFVWQYETADTHLSTITAVSLHIRAVIKEFEKRGHQVALIEAMASGCYCLSHHWDGVEEVLPIQNIYLTGNELQEKITEYSILSEEEKKKYQDQIRAISCEKFDMRHSIEKIRGIIENVNVNDADY